MLTLPQLKKYYSDIANVSVKSILVEYLQYELLDSLYKQKKSAFLSFIGGTALRIVYEENRFSEDLDFDNFGLSFDDFAELMEVVIADMKLKGFEMETRLVEKGAYHCYIKFPHILQESNISAAGNEKILVRIDIVRKDKNFEPILHTLNKFDIYRNILVNPPEIILAQKLITILQRKREKGRDFYDVSYLYGKTQPDFSYIEKTLAVSKNEFIEKLVARCEELDFKYLAKDVEPFLLQSEQSARVVDFLEFIKKQLSIRN
ncbi:MAG: nucleotidyl transferase AbiEii/AbiGii toxin family protein [Candidatus Moranbacteria bacterium]|jgi:predicted nucleotidyltransferase component of viral defense system|nr:nucleotidyl transferase AbiEii/AbiGii toxin family protein [Candidatus Moranbacteria bacterium]